ncbi:MAG TPA: sugar transferase [Gemmatimonadaceae bacterium]|nr:sugar transferase [Gemmatimonadaceae bacterium]
MVVVGAPEDIPRALGHPAVVGGRFQVVAALSVEVDADPSAEGVDRLAHLLDGHGAETILVAGSVGTPAMRRVADLALVHGCELLAVMPTEVPAGHDPVIVWSGDSPLVQLARIGRPAWELAAKRTIDIVGSAVGLVVLAPVLLVLCVLIRLESPGWPIFAHERVGYRGKKFNCLKLRTMRADAESTLRNDPAMYARYVENHYKIPDDLDPRTTRLGRFLRRTSLDELPQLWNVLVGEMSLVGPRPVVNEELKEYGDSAALLLSVRPGITGAWAVGGRHDVGYPERCEVELGYVRHRGVGEDFRILAATIAVVFRPQG